MTAEILTIGDEILIGQIVNTNSVWMAQQLNHSGIRVVHMCTIADDERAIAQALTDAGRRANLVLITGGLGPTRDDITKKVFAAFFDAKLQMHQPTIDRLEAYFAERRRALTAVNRDQALLPEGCVVLDNDHGTAPGMWMEKNNTIYISMPGVPYEMKAMLTGQVLPRIRNQYTLPHIYHKTVLTQGIGESALAEIISDWEDGLEANHIKLAYLPQPGMVRLRLSGHGPDLAALKALIDGAVETLKTLAGKYIYGYEDYGAENLSIEKVVSDMLHERKQTVSLAESCTGGYISSLIAAIPGASEVFAGAFVPYSNKAKHGWLNVDQALFTTVGAVSRECVEQLALNVLERSGSDYAISVSGIAGPAGGTPEKPVGTVWIAVATRNRVIPMKFIFGANRERNIVMTAHAALNMLRRLLLKEL